MPALIEIFGGFLLFSKTFLGFRTPEYRITSLVKGLALKDAILYSQSGKSGKCFTN